MTCQRTIPILFTLLLSALLSACDIGESPDNGSISDLPVGVSIVENQNSAEPPANMLACFYEHIDYGGAALCYDKRFTGTFDDLRLIAAWNDRVSSVALAPGVGMGLFEHAELQGEVLELTSSISYVGNAFNDIASSFIMYSPVVSGEISN